jgi:intermediate peptidase
MIGRTDYHNVSGTRCATDFVELPSILMEHFIASPAVLALFARHHSTDRQLPQFLLNSVIADRRRFSALETSTQITMASLDQVYHSSIAGSSSFDSTALLKSTQEKYNVIPYVEGTNWQTQFGHLFGYGSTYYSYLFDRSIAARIFKLKFAQDPLSRDRGEEFKKGVLRYGGGKDCWEMVGGLVGDEQVMRGGTEGMKVIGEWGIEADN